MKTLTSTAIVALTAGLIGIGGMMPSAIAQQQPQQPPMGQQAQPGDMPGQFHPRMQRPRMGQFNLQHRGGMNGKGGMDMAARGGPARGGMLDLICSDQAAERLEIALVRLSYRVDLTAEQQPLFDDLRTSALTAQTQFADQCATAAKPTASTNGAPDPVGMMRNRLELDKARIAALETVLPKFEAFFNSLSDQQKSQLAQRGNRGNGFGRHRGPGMNMQPGAPGQPPMNGTEPAAPSAPEAPAAAPTQG